MPILGSIPILTSRFLPILSLLPSLPPSLLLLLSIGACARFSLLSIPTPDRPSLCPSLLPVGHPPPIPPPSSPPWLLLWRCNCCSTLSAARNTPTKAPSAAGGRQWHLLPHQQLRSPVHVLSSADREWLCPWDRNPTIASEPVQRP